MGLHSRDDRIPQEIVYATRLGHMLGLMDAVLSGVTDLPAGRRRMNDLTRLWKEEDHARVAERTARASDDQVELASGGVTSTP